MVMTTFKKRLKFYMLKEGLNPASLSRKAKLNITAVRDILQHEGSPNTGINTFTKLCQALGVAPHQLSPEFGKFYTSTQRRMLEEAISSRKKKSANP
jgi:hypothetical protein